ncbi:hypothetical protein EUX98_g4004 [Antrodiella citrinella]|uniref:Major facilitator superfamily (MFS) profile domain-containing protein n=1 Tax=Antrodiella citrinella TaxID=2447956 RepID=A0A4S4MV66_9APHY|nr:hypothetical protein EUX98_g4004 [Antrodiella citrinella]
MAPLSGKPWGLKWRSSIWFVTSVVTLGITTDLLVYSMLIPVFPFRLQKLNYSDVSGLVGWLLFAYSAGLVATTPPIAFLSERYINRQHPLLLGQVFLMGSQVLLMEAPTYWVMILARVLQGISSSVIWVVGLAMLCDTVPEAAIGTQLGIAMSGVSLGGPFIFGIIVTFVDSVGRLLIVERKDALLYDLDNWATKEAVEDVKKQDSEQTLELSPAIVLTEIPLSSPSTAIDVDIAEPVVTRTNSPKVQEEKIHVVAPRHTVLGVLGILMRSSRAVSALLITLLFGIIYTSQEPTLPLHLQAIWGLSSARIGVIYIAAVVPTLASSVFTGWATDRWGAEWLTVMCFLLAIPWIVVTILEKSLALFIVAMAFQSLFITGNISPVTAELAAVARQCEGLGYAHVYGAFNFFYGL